MPRSLTLAAQYRAIYVSLWRLNERHYTRGHSAAANDNLDLPGAA